MYKSFSINQWTLFKYPVASDTFIPIRITYLIIVSSGRVNNVFKPIHKKIIGFKLNKLYEPFT